MTLTSIFGIRVSALSVTDTRSTNIWPTLPTASASCTLPHSPKGYLWTGRCSSWT